MKFLHELKTFFITITDWLVLFIVFSCFFFGFNVGEMEVWGRVFSFVVPTSHSFAVDVFRMMVADLGPASVPIIVTSPLTAFIAQVKVALLLSFAFTFPILCYRVIRFIAPALYMRERIALYAVTVSASLLFIGGVVFAYVLVIPTTLSLLYAYAAPIGAVPYLSIDAFLGLSLALMLIAGITATIPVVMVLLTSLHVVPALFWVEKWRYAAVIMLIASAIITPDGSGVSMTLLSIPGVFLYGLGMFVSVGIERKNRKKLLAVPGNS